MLLLYTLQLVQFRDCHQYASKRLHDALEKDASHVDEIEFENDGGIDDAYMTALLVDTLFHILVFTRPLRTSSLNRIVYTSIWAAGHTD